MKNILLKSIFVALTGAMSTISFANTVQKTTIDGYKLYGCVGFTKEQKLNGVKKDYCKDKKSLKKIVDKSKSMKINFDKNKKLVQHIYKIKYDYYVSDFFVIDDKKKEIYLQPNYAYYTYFYNEFDKKQHLLLLLVQNIITIACMKKVLLLVKVIKRVK